jgi:hypothetical protein
MKKILTILASIMFVVALSSCVPDAHRDLELPFGVWMSVEPTIILYIEREYQHPLQNGEGQTFLGIYTTEHEEIKIFTMLNIFSGFLTLQRTDSWDVEHGGISGEGRIFVGGFEVIDDKIYYRLNDVTREETGYNAITFHRLGNYESINPDDWFPHLSDGEYHSVTNDDLTIIISDNRDTSC